jgi:exonuclease SbcD
MRFLHCSDLHLGRKPIGSVISEYSQKRYEDYFKAFDFVVEKALKEKVDAFVVSGDLFDRKDLSPDVLERAENILSKLKVDNIPVVCVEGNHDRTFKVDEKSWLEYLSQEGLIHLLKPFVSENGEIHYPPWDGKKGAWLEIKGIRFYGVGYQGFQFPEYIQKLVLELNSDQRNVVIVHTSAGEPERIMGCVKEEDLISLGRKCEYIAGGHIHTKRTFEDLNLFVPGAPEYWDIAEKGQKGFFIYDTEKKEITYYESRKRKKIDVFVKVNDGSNSEFSREFQKAIVKNPAEPDCLYVLNVEVPFGVFLDVDTKAVEKELETLGALKGWVTVNFSNTFAKNETGTLNEIEMLEEEIIKSNPSFASHSTEMAHALGKLKALHNSSQNMEESFQVLDELFEVFGGMKDEDKQR